VHGGLCRISPSRSPGNGQSSEHGRQRLESHVHTLLRAFRYVSFLLSAWGVPQDCHLKEALLASPLPERGGVCYETPMSYVTGKELQFLGTFFIASLARVHEDSRRDWAGIGQKGEGSGWVALSVIAGARNHLQANRPFEFRFEVIA